MPSTQTTGKTRKRTKKVTQDQLDEAVRKAKEEAEAETRATIEQERAEEEFDEPEMEEGGLGTLGFSEGIVPEHGDIESEEQAHNAWDLFEWVQKEYADKSVPVIYHIKKDNQIMGELPAPCSWVHLQKKYGGGTYQVIARHGLTKTYIKSHTQIVGEPERKDESEEKVIIQQPPAGPQLDPNQLMSSMLGAFQQMQENMSKKEAREERDEKKSSEAFNSTFLQLMQGQQQATQTMFLEIAKMNSESTKVMSENFSKVVEKMDDKFTKMFDKISDNKGKGDEFSLKDILALQESASSKTWEQWQTINEMIDGVREEASQSSGDGDSKDSMLSSLVKAFVPVLSNVNRAQQIGLNQVQGQQRRPVHPTGSQISTGSTHNPTGQTTNPQDPSSHLKAKRSQQANAGSQGGGNTSIKNSPKITLGLPTFSDNSSNTEDEVVINHTGFKPSISEEFVEEPTKDAVKSDNNSGDLDSLLANATKTQELIVHIGLPTIGQGISGQLTPSEAGEVFLSDCMSQGIESSVVLKEFGFDLLMQVVRAFGIGNEFDSWFEDFYAHISDNTRDGIIGESEPSLS